MVLKEALLKLQKRDSKLHVERRLSFISAIIKFLEVVIVL